MWWNAPLASVLALLAGPVARAEEPPPPSETTDPAPPDEGRGEGETSERPLAIPASGRSPGAEPLLDRPPRPDRPRAEDFDVRALREYRNHHLSLRTVADTWISTSWTGWGWGPGWAWGPGYGYGYAAWPRTWIHQDTRLVVFEGHVPLDVPATLGELGDVSAQQDLLRRIRRNRRATSVLDALGLLGLGVAVGGLVGLEDARTVEDQQTWGAISAGGAGLMLGGFVGSAFPGARAKRLLLDPTATFEPGEVERRVEEHNARLADALGLPEEHAARVDAEEWER